MSNPALFLQIGIECAKEGDIYSALEVYEDGLNKFPDDNRLKWRFSLLKLLMGEFEYWPEATWTGGWYKRFIPNPPVWDGSSLKGKTIFIHHDQGIGDFIHFIRYVEIVKKCYFAEKVVVECENDFVGLCKNIDGIDEIARSTDNTFGYSVHAPLMCLPRLVGINTGFTPYIFLPSKFKSKLEDIIATSSNYKVGVCWKGNPHYTDDVRRSMPNHFVHRWNNIPGISLFNLTKGEADEKLTNICLLFDGWLDTAAAIRNMDLIISVDTAVAHLAAAMGKPVWLLLPKFPDWRWGLRGMQTKWYSNMFLFRQDSENDWLPVAESVRENLLKIKL